MYATASEWGVRIRGGLKLTMVEVGKLLADLAEMERALRACVETLGEGYAALYSEYVSCPWCAGHIGHDNTWHADNCRYMYIIATARKILEEACSG